MRVFETGAKIIAKMKLSPHCKDANGISVARFICIIPSDKGDFKIRQQGFMVFRLADSLVREPANDSSLF